MRSAQLLTVLGFVAAKSVIPLPPLVSEIQEALGIQVAPGQEFPGRFPFGFNLIPKRETEELGGQQAAEEVEPVEGEPTYDVNERGQFRSPAAFAAAITNQSGLPGAFADSFAEMTAQGSQTLVDFNKSVMRWLKLMGEGLPDPAAAYSPIERAFEAAAAATPDNQIAATIPVISNFLRLLTVPIQGMSDGVQAMAIEGPYAELHSLIRLIENVSPVQLDQPAEE